MASIPLKTTRVSSNHSDDFSETVDFVILQCTNVSGNNNKFYSIEIQRNPKTNQYRLFSHYGRLDTTSIYEVRETDKQGNSLTEQRCRLEFDKIVKKKQRGKKVKRNGETIHEAYHIVDVVIPTVGSTNICNSTKVTAKGTPLIDTSSYDTETSSMINEFVKENIHTITSQTNFTFTSNGLETSLGPVTESHLQTAEDVLKHIRDLFDKSQYLDPSNQKVREYNSEYFSLIPRKFGYTITDQDLILTPDKLSEEFSLLDNLRTAVRMGLISDNNELSVKFDIDHMKRQDEWLRIEQWFEQTKHRNHSAIHGYHVKNIFTLNIPDVTKRYEKKVKQLGNEHELFHGTKTSNMLSILFNGLIIPPTGAAHVTGRMFGNGIYAASCSTKALNYSVGYWNGRHSYPQRAYVLIVNFAMGKEYTATSARYSGAPSGYDSIWAKAGHSLLNDEFIVYDLSQATITHILQLEK